MLRGPEVGEHGSILQQNHRKSISVWEANSENCSDLIFAVIVPDTNYVTSAIRKLMLDMPGPGSFQNIGLLLGAKQGSEHVKPCGSNWVKIKEA